MISQVYQLVKRLTYLMCLAEGEQGAMRLLNVV
ncbi:hypothetical protein DFQ12_3233 [Sphingobacterium detergens]|uniref:Uncharacterized protein n=1 Tax=Sphingobacterium detergens TaxID=1145106 RepID=A0A420B871_SPHD1|nr:hypothetical protein DFQ12_3233 [Sphingobacterium detergens]